MGASLCVCACVQLGWGLILLFHSSRVTNRINSGLPTEQGDTLAALFEESITGDGSATDPIVQQSLCIHAKQEHKTSQFAGKLRHSFGPHMQSKCWRNMTIKLAQGGIFLTLFSDHITFSELVTLEIRRVNLLSFQTALFLKPLWNQIKSQWGK